MSPAITFSETRTLPCCGHEIAWDPKWFEEMRQLGLHNAAPGEEVMTEEGVLQALAERHACKVPARIRVYQRKDGLWYYAPFTLSARRLQPEQGGTKSSREAEALARQAFPNTTMVRGVARYPQVR